MNKERINRVYGKMKEMNLDYLLITDSSSINYLTDVRNWPGERFYCLMLSTKREPVFFLNKLFAVSKDLPIEEVWFADTEDPTIYLAKYIDDHSVVGIDKFMAAKWLLSLMEKKQATYVNGSLAVDGVKMVKEEKEIELMRKASLINDAAIEQLAATIKEGDSEDDIAARLLPIYQSMEAYEYSFEPIVAFQVKGSDPHHGHDGTILQEGDSITIDMGCKYQGYCSDMTRTYFYKKISERQKYIYNLVRKANESAEAIIKPGVRLCDIDKTARDIIANEGYGEYFTHRLGHFIGRDCHEFADVSAAFDLPVEEGMIFSIEPGIYLPGEFGVRIEDLVLVTKDGCEILNHYSKDIQIIE